MNTDREKAVAYHEAGHAIAFVHFNLPIASCWIEDGAEPHGRTELQGVVGPECHRDLVILWAGPIAEMRVDPFAVVAEGDQSTAKQVLNNLGAGASWLDMIDLLQRTAKEAVELVERDWPSIELVAHALLERKSLHGEEVYALSKAVKP
jgi:hypothetical protein